MKHTKKDKPKVCLEARRADFDKNLRTTKHAGGFHRPGSLKK